MRKIAAFLILLLCQSVASFTHAQTAATSTVIRLDTLYKGYGVIFDKNYEPGIIINNVAQRYTPSKEEITKAEQIFLSQYNEANQASPTRQGAKYITKPKKFFWKYYRQYLGFINNNGDKNVLIHLLDFSKPGKAKRGGGAVWKEHLVIILAQPMPFNILTYRVNLDQNKLFADF